MEFGRSYRPVESTDPGRLAREVARPSRPSYAPRSEPSIQTPGASIRAPPWGHASAACLESAAEVRIRQVRRGPRSIEVDVDATNSGTGHHVPTGLTVRNMILLVEAWRDADDTPLLFTGDPVVHDLGGIGDPADGYYAGEPGKFFAKVNYDASNHGPTFFTDAVGIEFDNRIPALATDTSSYRFQVPPGTGAVHVRARLITGGLSASSSMPRRGPRTAMATRSGTSLRPTTDTSWSRSIAPTAFAGRHWSRAEG